MKSLRKILLPVDAVFGGWLLITFFLILFRRYPLENALAHLLFRVIAIFVLFGVAYFTRNMKADNFIKTLLRYGYPAFLFYILFSELCYTDGIYFDHTLDPYVIAIEQALFGCQPSVAFWYAVPWDIVSEIFHAAYFSFYFMFAFVLLVPLFQKRFAVFAEEIFTITFSFLACYLVYSVIPVASPRIGLPEAALIPHNGYFFSGIMVNIFENGNVPNAAFPSSHCAMATVNTLLVWKFIPKAKYPFTVLAFLLVCATVYCRYHYLTDSLAGIFFGAVCFLISGRFLSYLIGKGFLWGVENKNKAA